MAMNKDVLVVETDSAKANSGLLILWRNLNYVCFMSLGPASWRLIYLTGRINTNWLLICPEAPPTGQDSPVCLFVGKAAPFSSSWL